MEETGLFVIQSFVLLCAVLALFVGLLAMALCKAAAPRDDAEQARDDAEQMEYLTRVELEREAKKAGHAKKVGVRG